MPQTFDNAVGEIRVSNLELSYRLLDEVRAFEDDFPAPQQTFDNVFDFFLLEVIKSLQHPNQLD